MWSPERTIDIIRIIGIQAHTASIELPIKISSSFCVSYVPLLYPNASVTLPLWKHLSTEKYYTSDYLSKFTSNQYGLGFTYTDIFTRAKIFVLD
jgi:hypothetical protein